MIKCLKTPGYFANESNMLKPNSVKTTTGVVQNKIFTY